MNKNIKLYISESKALVLGEAKAILGEDFLNINLNEYTITSFLEEISHFSLFDESRNYFVDLTDFFDRRLLDSEASHYADLVLRLKNITNEFKIVFFTKGTDKRKKHVKEFLALADVHTLEVNYKTINGYIEEYTKEHGYLLDFELKSYLVNNFGYDFDLIKSELDKLFIYFIETKNIVFDEAVNIISENINSNIFKLFNLIFRKNFTEAYNLFKDLVLFKEDETKILLMLYREVKLQLMFNYFFEKDFNLTHIERELGLPDWKVQKLYEQKNSFDTTKLEELIKLFSYSDFYIKSGTFDKEIVLNNIFINLVD